MTVARKLAVTAVLAAVLGLAPFMSMTAKAAPGLGQARLTSYATAQQPANVTVTRKCTYGSSSGNVRTCFTTYHRGRYVLEMKLSGCVVHSARQLFEGIGGPQGPLVENPDPQGFWIIPGYCNTIAWHPFSTVPRGKYCGYTYRVVEKNGAVHGYLIGKECIRL